MLTPVTHLPSPPLRPADSHKGTFGTVIVVGGCETMMGAPALAASAAFRAGAGLVKIATRAAVLPTAIAIEPSATGIIIGDDIATALHQIERADPEQRAVLAIGPGLGQSERSRDLVTALLAGPRAVVLDADGLNVLATSLTATTILPDGPDIRPDSPGIGPFSPSPLGERARVRGPNDLGHTSPPSFAKTPSPQPSPPADRGRGGRFSAHSPLLILTPHPGEFQRLATALKITASPTDSTQRPQAAAALAKALGAIVLLKGRHTIVTDGDRVYTNQTGNPALATAGTGDVLTGVIAALLAQGMPPFDAAALGAHLHGLTADLWARANGERGLTARDLAALLPRAFQTLRPAASNQG